MKTLSIFVAALALVSAGTAGASAATPSASPASAQTMSAAQCATGEKADQWSTIFLADKLDVKNIKYNSISADGNCFKVAVVGSNGKVTPELYDPVTLQRVKQGA